MTWPYALVGILSAADVLIGGYVLANNASRSLNRVFFAFAFGMALIGIGMVFLFITHHIFFDRVIFAGGYLMTCGLVLLSMKFPADEPLRPVTWLIFLPLGALAVLTPFGFLVKEVIFRPDGILQPVNGPGIPAFATIIGAYISLSAWNFWKRHGSLSGPARLQMQYLALGAGIFAFVTFLCNVLLPALGVFELNMLGPISSLAFVGAVAYAIIRHRLLDIRVVIQRGAIYLALVTAVIGFYLFLIFFLGAWFHKAFDREDMIFLGVGILTVCTGIFTVPRLERYFRRVTDEFFFKDRYDYAQALHNLSAILNQNIETAKIVQRTSQALRSILKASEAHVVLFRDRSDPAAKLSWYPQVRSIALQSKGTILLQVGDRLRREHGIEVITSILLGRRPLGAIVLGPKMSGDPYRDEDAQLLTTFSYQAAVALEKARLFEKVKKHSGTLEARVRERTAALEQLQEEQRQMMVDISHRLQTPLTAVKSELDFLKRQPDPPEHLDAFERSIDGISKFIYDLLNLAKLGITKNDFPKARVDLSGLLRDLAEYFEVMANERNIRLSARIQPRIFIFGNQDHLEELVMNLVSNAFKYLQAGRDKKVAIVLRQTEERAVLEVVDSGRGIGPEDLDRIFERFYRGRGADIDDTSGTGLGLAIAKRIVENHGGTITIESELGQGTKVIVLLPCLESSV